MTLLLVFVECLCFFYIISTYVWHRNAHNFNGANDSNLYANNNLLSELSFFANIVKKSGVLSSFLGFPCSRMMTDSEEGILSDSRYTIGGYMKKLLRCAKGLSDNWQMESV